MFPAQSIRLNLLSALRAPRRLSHLPHALPVIVSAVIPPSTLPVRTHILLCSSCEPQLNHTSKCIPLPVWAQIDLEAAERTSTVGAQPASFPLLMTGQCMSRFPARVRSAAAPCRQFLTICLQHFSHHRLSSYQGTHLPGLAKPEDCSRSFYNHDHSDHTILQSATVTKLRIHTFSAIITVISGSTSQSLIPASPSMRLLSGDHASYLIPSDDSTLVFSQRSLHVMHPKLVRRCVRHYTYQYSSYQQSTA